MHVGISLLTLVPGGMGGSESYVRALLDQFARGNALERVTLIATDAVVAAYAKHARGPVSFHRVRGLVADRPPALRAASMLVAAVLPRRLPGGLVSSTTRSPCRRRRRACRTWSPCTTSSTTTSRISSRPKSARFAV